MARKTNQGQPPKRPANLNPEQKRSAIELLERRVRDLGDFDINSINAINDPRINVQSQAVDTALVNIFGPDTVDYERYQWASHLRTGSIFLPGYRPTIAGIRQELEEGKAKAIATLEGIIDRFREELELAGSNGANEKEAVQKAITGSDSRRVFIVHGRDEGARESVARFLEKIDLKPIILHERPNKGRTLITKFREESADTGFAVVLMTPDDLGALVGASASQYRARQNVVFELGFFIGKLGPERVAALVKGNIERPSDFDGVLYVALDDAGSWKQQLARELEAVSYKIDWNKVMRG